MKLLTTLFLLFALLTFTACEGPSLGGKVKKEYFKGGKVSSEFIMTDKTGLNGKLKKYGYEGHLTSEINIKNGVKHGTELWYDRMGRIIRKVPYDNGKIHGTVREMYPNGTVMATIQYRHNIRQGKAYSYKKDGKVFKKVIFKDGRIIN